MKGVTLLLRPEHHVEDVEGVAEDGLHHGVVVRFRLLGEGGDDAGAALAATVDDHPAAAAADDRSVAVAARLVQVRAYVDGAGLAQVNLPP